MGLFTKDKLGQAIFFSPAKIAAVRIRQEELETQKEQEKLEKNWSGKMRLLRGSTNLRKLKNDAKLRKRSGLKSWSRSSEKKKLVRRRESLPSSLGSKSSQKRIMKSKLLQLERENRRIIFLGSRNSPKRRELVVGAL